MQRGFRIGPWTVSPLTGEIETDGRSVHLEPKVMEVLVVLAENAETVVLRETLLDRVWGPRAATSDEPLTRCIAQLRQSLGDSSRDPRFIQTVPKRGYRLLLPAGPRGDTAPSGPRAAEPPPSPGARGVAPRPWQGIVMIGALAVLGVAAYLALPLVERPGDVVDPCNIEQQADPAFAAIEKAVELNPDSPVIRDRYGIVLMWLGRDEAAREQFDAAAALPHQPYAASELVWRIRQLRWSDVEEKLRQIARLRQTGDTAWIGDFVAALRDRGDPAARERAVAAVGHAVERGYLAGQYAYGAWLYVGETGRAFEAAFESLNASAAGGGFDVEFLFAPETRALREHARFEEILGALGLFDYWSDDARNCPAILEAWAKTHWCD